MNSDPLQERVLAIGSMHGLLGCALVDVETGMAWKAAGGEGIQILCEAASDFWRLQMRQSKHYSEPVGEVSAQVLIHTRGRITLVRVVDTLLLVTVSREPDQVDWAQWKNSVGQLKDVATSI